MLTVDTANMLIGILSLFIAYCICVTLVGSFRSYIALKMGDDTSAQLGFMSLNPLMHMDPFGILFLIFFHFGWGRFVPVNPLNIQGKFRTLKVAVASFSDTVAHLLFALLCVLLLVAGFHWPLFCSVTPEYVYKIGFSEFAGMFQNSSSLSMALSFIVISLVYLNIILCVLTIILNTFWLIALRFGEHFRQHGFWGQFMLLLIPLLLMQFFSGPLRMLAHHFLCTVVGIIAHLLVLI